MTFDFSTQAALSNACAMNSNSCTINEEEFSLFQTFLCENSGILVPIEKAYLFETRLSRIMAEMGCATFGDFYAHICSHRDPRITQKIIDAMVTNETMWFRDAHPFDVLRDVVLPELVSALADGRKNRARIWCAAVSTGQEAYSAAMCVHEYLKCNEIRGVDLSQFEFWATDISERVLEIAKNGRYDAISMMRGMSEKYRQAYFREENGAWNIDPTIRDAVRFIKFNLQENFRTFGVFDVIFCRYVLIYFSPEAKARLVKKLSGSLAQNGVLFAESYISSDLFEEDYDIKHCENFMYYRKKAVK